eukprot:TRINITY_DN91486_c0_g1_i2.p1 TRINITY_DN91486_c0_g1~~TRINITY_DN91486_c0_g1_i2.p1  ORF type:complete len:264 (+),score=42.41 TRINITY_DN91486_c0_g1_i2:80-871(+)
MDSGPITETKWIPGTWLCWPPQGLFTGGSGFSQPAKPQASQSAAASSSGQCVASERCAATSTPPRSSPAAASSSTSTTAESSSSSTSSPSHGSAAGRAPSPAAPAPRLLARPSSPRPEGQAAGRRGATAQGRGANGRIGGALSLGPRGGDGYHDVVLTCGLLQDEVIDITFRDLNPEDFDLLLRLDEKLEKKNTMQRSLVEQLPRVLARDCGKTECGVCLADFDPTLRVVQLPCKHAFHQACISKWLTQCKDTCPLCSASISV